MTLVVSVRVPDGIVVGADSLATLAVQSQAQASAHVICPNCNHEHELNIEVPLPRGMGTLSTLPYALKLVPVWGTYAVANFGNSMIGEHSMFSLIQEFQREVPPAGLEESAKHLAEWLHGKFGVTVDLASVPDDSFAFGFHMSGQVDGHPTTVVAKIGKVPNLQTVTGLGATVDGETDVVVHMWQLSQTSAHLGATFQAWSISDAADYVEFLIAMTANLQRFGLMVPTVGGDIDMALITSQNKFRWMKKKKLADLLLEEEKTDGSTTQQEADISGAGAV